MKNRTSELGSPQNVYNVYQALVETTTCTRHSLKLKPKLKAPHTSKTYQNAYQDAYWALDEIETKVYSRI